LGDLSFTFSVARGAIIVKLRHFKRQNPQNFPVASFGRTNLEEQLPHQLLHDVRQGKGVFHTRGAREGEKRIFFEVKSEKSV